MKKHSLSSSNADRYMELQQVFDPSVGHVGRETTDTL